MRVDHMVYLLIKSEDIEPEEMTRLIGLSPDEAKTRHSRLVGGTPVPKVHLWRAESGLDVDEPVERHLEALAGRLAPHADRIGGIVTDRTKCFLTIVRCFHPSHDPARLGFGIDGETLELLDTMRAEIDVDEYDYDEG
jgi:hypothetical protein